MRIYATERQSRNISEKHIFKNFVTGVTNVINLNGSVVNWTWEHATYYRLVEGVGVARTKKNFLKKIKKIKKLKKKI